MHHIWVEERGKRLRHSLFTCRLPYQRCILWRISTIVAHIHRDGSNGRLGSWIGCLMLHQMESELKSCLIRFQVGGEVYQLVYRFKAVHTVLFALKTTIELGAKSIKLFIDSKFITSKIEGLYEARCERMDLYHNVLWHITCQFDSISISQTLR